ncbi:MAG: hypothetical protein KJZ93_28240 [Caldilineaceae bacterium]|nr:hypothetical protein [Caldilineaceae bacterium]
MTFIEQPLLVTTVGDDRTIVLPDSIPSGATIGIVVLSDRPKRKLTRKERFKAALTEIEAAIIRSQQEPIDLPADAEFNALIERARKEPHAHRS